ncbi:hypothetical protein ACFQ2B_11640 [Streptomyces stramineus]
MRSTEGASVFYKKPFGESLIQVFTLNGPETTPYESLTATEKTVSKNKGYSKIGLARTSGSGDAAELEYTYTASSGNGRHVRIFAYTASDRGSTRCWSPGRPPTGRRTCGSTGRWSGRSARPATARERGDGTDSE